MNTELFIILKIFSNTKFLQIRSHFSLLFWKVLSCWVDWQQVSIPLTFRHSHRSKEKDQEENHSERLSLLVDSTFESNTDSFPNLNIAFSWASVLLTAGNSITVNKRCFSRKEIPFVRIGMYTSDVRDALMLKNDKNDSWIVRR